MSKNTGFKIPGHWWGKLIGGIIGALRGGLIGVVLGVLIGHLVDRFLAGLSGRNRTRDTFFRALFSTLGHISKADGLVTKAEVEAAENLMRRMTLTEEERHRAIRFFQQGKDPEFDFYRTLQQFAKQAKRQYELRVKFLELLLEAAITNGTLSVAEDAILERVRIALDIPIKVYVAMMGAREKEPEPSYSTYRSPTRKIQTLAQSYAALGLLDSANPQEVKQAYRKLVSQYHPDKLSSQGLPDEVMEMAKRRVREINAAYDKIKASKVIK